MNTRLFRNIALVVLALLVIAASSQLTICHKPGPHQRTIRISENAWPAHDRHDDYKGTCSPWTPDPETPDDDPQTPDDDPQTPGPEPVTAGASDNDVTAITRLTYSNGRVKVYTVGSVGKFRLRKQGARGVRWLEPTDFTAVTFNEHRSILNVGELSPGTYFLFAHHSSTGNSGDDGERFIVPGS